jgi:transposase
MYYGWSKEFLEAGKRRLAGDTAAFGDSSSVSPLVSRNSEAETRRGR